MSYGELSPADYAAISGNNNNDGFGGNGAYWIIILFFAILMFGGWGGNGMFGGGWGRGNGGGSNGGSSGAADNYVLASDFATIQRQLSDGFGAQERRTDAVINGLCDGFYSQAQLTNGLNQAISQQGYDTRNAITQAQIGQMQSANALQAQLAQCCCDNRAAIADVNYNLASQANALANQLNNCCCESQRQIERGFCDTNYALATNTTAIMQNAHNDTDRILSKLSDIESTRQQERIAQLQSENQSLRFAASQQAQNAMFVANQQAQTQQIISACNPQPVPAYIVCNPNTGQYYQQPAGCGCC